MDRNLLLQEDANVPLNLLTSPDLTITEWLAHRFRHIPDSMIGTIVWDMGLESEAWSVYTRTRLLPLRDSPKLQEWAAQGIDWLDQCIETAARHGIASFWNHRISEVDLPHPWINPMGLPPDDKRRENNLKKAHPEWLLPCWWPQGLWNLAHPELRRHKLAILRELMENYRLSGLQLDFARHTPCLPPGREWEMRDHATEFVRMVRSMLDEVGKKRNEKLELMVRVGDTIAGNHLDGLEVERWIAEDLIDVLVPGGRGTVDIAGFRNLRGGERIRICPSFDAHHTAEGYHAPCAEYLRGFFCNFLYQGADSISLFNWFGQHDRNTPDDPAELALFREGGSLKKMAPLPKMYAAESRGEYPWAQNYIYRGEDKPLPAVAAHGAGAIIPIEIYQDRPLDRLEILVEGMKQGDIEELCLNGIPLTETAFLPERPDRYAMKKCTYPAAVYAIDENMRLPKGRNRISVLFRPNRNPRLFTIRRMEIFTK